MSETEGQEIEPNGTTEGCLGSDNRPLELSGGCASERNSCDIDKPDEEDRKSCGCRESCDE